MIHLYNLIKTHLLCEGLIKSYDIHTTKNIIKKWSIGSSKFILSPRMSGYIDLEFIDIITINEFENLLKVINACGWYISIYSLDPYVNRKYNYREILSLIEKKVFIADMCIEAKYDVEISKYTLQTLYHASPKKYEEKIKRIGLVPKGKGKVSVHPERIYLTADLGDVELIVPQLKHATKDTGTYNVYQIDVDKLIRKNKSIKFYKDPAFKDRGLYTLSNIPPDCLTLIKTL